MIEEGRVLIKGNIIFDKNNLKSFSGATIYVRLEDVTMQDAPSKLILQQVIKDVSYDHLTEHNQKKFEFELIGDTAIDFQSMYAISVHIDVDNDSKVSLGDFINMESYPVITHGDLRDNISVYVRQVK